MSNASRSMALLGAASLFLSGAAARGDESETASQLDGVRLGDVVYGPSLTKEDLKGRVVLLVFWGIK